MARPSTSPTWATTANYPAGSSDWSGQATKVQPSSAKIAQGLTPNTDQPAEEFNWFFNLVSLWIAYLDAWLIGVLNPTPPAVGTDAAQVLMKDAAGSNRFLISHNGFVGSTNNLLREEWKLPISFIGVGGTITNNPIWFLSVAGSPTGISTQPPTATVPGTYLVVSTQNVNANKLVVSSNGQWMHPGCTFASWELRADFSMDAIGNNGMTHWFGFSGSKDASAPASGYAWFKKATTDTNWQCQTNNGATTTNVDSGVVPTIDGTMQRLRIEHHGSASPFGAVTTRFFINDVLVATSTTNLPTAAQYVVFGSLCTSGGTGHDCDVGTVELSVNRYAAGGST